MNEAEKELISERLELSMERIRGFLTEGSVAEPYRGYFRQVARFLLMIGELSAAVQSGEADSWDEGTLSAMNRRLYEDILPEHYDKSFANPAFAAETLGPELGKLLCFLYTEIRGDIVYAFEGRLFDIVIYNEALIEIYNLFEADQVPDEKEVRGVLYWCASDYADVTVPYRVRECIDPSLDFAKKIVMESDFHDLSYLYRYGEYVSDEVLKLASYMNRIPEEKVRRMADTFTEGFRRGFEVMRRDLSKKRTVAVCYHLGFERMIRMAVENFEAMGLSVILPRAAVDSVNRKPSGKSGYVSTSANRQYDYDHRYDSAVYLDKAFRDRKLAVLKTAYEQYKRETGEYAGPAVLEVFGEEGFSPVDKPENPAFDGKQQRLFQEYKNLSMPIVNEYVPSDETSFTIIAFPLPSIGRDFEEIFSETIRINTLDSGKYQLMQQKLIDALDAAEYVEVEGEGANRTNMRVALAELTDRNAQTKFENCLADVNIPLGEVFTSPRLAGTEGRLNVSSVYIGEIQFKNLYLECAAGRVTKIACDNFLETLPPDCSAEEREKARAAGERLARQVIMGGRDSLPFGEFAIGTNTTAYAMAERFGIIDKLPILIVEKMGPHFAVGDTCYSWSEDSPMYNPNGKEMIARDNEISILRKEDVEKAYFGVHTDITIPYRELKRIDAISADGTATGILRDGRFILPGLEELNSPFSS